MLTFLIVIIILWHIILYDRHRIFRIGLPCVTGAYIVTLTVVDTFWLSMITLGLVLVVGIFCSSVILGWQTVIFGLPSMVFFCYSFIFRQNALWVTAISSMIFFVGLLLNLLRDVEENEEFFYALGLATIGVIVIPAISPQFNLLCGIAEISGTAIGLAPRLILEILEHVG